MRDLDALFVLLEERARRPFAWGRGRNDCAGFVLAAIAAQTGRDILPTVTWTTRRGAARVLRRLGGLEAAFDARLTPIAPAFARRGDVAAIVDERLGISVMIVEGTVLVGPGTRGLTRLPRSAMIRAWSVEPRPRTDAGDTADV